VRWRITSDEWRQQMCPNQSLTLILSFIMKLIGVIEQHATHIMTGVYARLNVTCVFERRRRSEREQQQKKQEKKRWGAL